MPNAESLVDFLAGNRTATVKQLKTFIEGLCQGHKSR